MSTINVAIIILAVVGGFYIRHIARRQKPQQELPDKIRLRKLWVQLWCCIICMILFFAFIGVMYARDVSWPPLFSLLVFVVIGSVLAGMIFAIRRCKKSVDNDDA